MHTINWCLFFALSPCLFLGVFGPMWAHNKHVLKVEWVPSVIDLYIIVIICIVTLCYFFFRAVQKIMVLIWYYVLLFPSNFLGMCFFYKLYMCFCVLKYVDMFQYLQRIWKRASGKWRGSCCSWRETWRLFPPLMTPTTCSSLKCLYPLHKHAFPHWSGELFSGFTVRQQNIRGEKNNSNIFLMLCKIIGMLSIALE